LYFLSKELRFSNRSAKIYQFPLFAIKKQEIFLSLDKTLKTRKINNINNCMPIKIKSHVD